MEDTIAAISTTTGIGAISIIRLSGPEAINITNKVFTKNLTNAETHTIHYGFVMDEDGKKMDYRRYRKAFHLRYGQ